MSDKHTPGPWVFHPYDNFIIGLDGKRIIEMQARSLDCSIEERDANSRLAAAAPELLEALIEAIDAVKTFHGPDCWEIYEQHSPEMKRWRSVIAKVKGVIG